MAEQRALRIPVGAATLDADLNLPDAPRGLVLFAHGSGSSRFSPRNRQVAQALNAAGLATLLADLLTPDEERIDVRTRQLRFDIGLLAQRLAGLTDWLRTSGPTQVEIGYFGASTGAGAALVAAAQRPDAVRAVVSRGGRPDLAGPALARVAAPTLLIVGGNDDVVIDLNRQALALLHSRQKHMEIVPGATHLFEEPGTLEAVSSLARDWFLRYLGAGPEEERP